MTAEDPLQKLAWTSDYRKALYRCFLSKDHYEHRRLVHNSEADFLWRLCLRCIWALQWCLEEKTRRVGWSERLVSYCLRTAEVEKESHSEEANWVCGPLAGELDVVTMMPAL